MLTTVFFAITALGLRGRFALPDSIWIWWLVSAAIINLAGGAVLGWIAGKVAPVRSA